ncbi:Aste57867_9885 [Aphanomyces stellatus]|uniref:Aste57867_9885 protein n=1 Tax=Aphanomyces stellatus TaxID=120398 RepID=A0A485KPM1_9STRA|nr:hypothetical protein As57867_009846 [Aphanomyces stellatus]VFT86764.1 Aste57867_9885 [Aphanomyces stellatus]
MRGRFSDRTLVVEKNDTSIVASCLPHQPIGPLSVLRAQVPMHWIGLASFVGVARAQMTPLTTLAVPTATPYRCSSLTDPGNPVFDALVSRFVDRTTLAHLNVPSTWLTCLGGSMDAMATTMAAEALGHSSCVASVPSLASLAATSWLGATVYDTDLSVQALCSAMKNSFAPCLKDAIIPTLSQILARSPCCGDNLMQELGQATGAKLDVLLTTFVDAANNILCSTQAPGFDGSTVHICATAWLQAVAHVPNVHALATVVQMPNDQGCAAAIGKSFTTTTDPINPITLFAPSMVPGACVLPVQDFVDYVRLWPLVAKSTWGPSRVADLFDDGKCIHGSDVAAALFGGQGLNLTGTFADVAANVFGRLSCLHVANGPSLRHCPFPNKIMRQVAPIVQIIDAEIPQVADATATTNKTTATVVAIVAVVFALVVGVSWRKRVLAKRRAAAAVATDLAKSPLSNEPRATSVASF